MDAISHPKRSKLMLLFLSVGSMLILYHGFTYLLEGVVVVERETPEVLWDAEEPVVDDVAEGFGEPFSVESFELTSATHGRWYNSTLEENQWLLGARGRICEIANAMNQINATDRWVSYSSGVFRSNKKPYKHPSIEQSTSLSYFTNGDYTEYIEPLHGYLRHPKFGICEGNFNHLFDISYLIISNHCGFANSFAHRHIKPKKTRNIFFDLGASTGFRGVKKGMYSEPAPSGSALGPSIPLFYSLYADKCIEFDDIFAWEVTNYKPKEWWGSLSPQQRSKVRFYNIPVEERSDGRSNPNSFLHLLKNFATPEDFVVVKVDIDTLSAEVPIVKALAEYPSLSNLVDEIFFEYHVYMDGLSFGWRDNTSDKDDVDDALKLMYKLRQLGIRSHFWI